MYYDFALGFRVACGIPNEPARSTNAPIPEEPWADTPPVKRFPPKKFSTDWPQLGFDTRRTGFNPHEQHLGSANVGALEILWTNSVGFTINTGVCVADGVVYYGNYGGEFRAVDAATGEPIWTRSLEGSHTGQAVVDGVVYVTSRATYASGGKVYAFDASNGKTIWLWDARDRQVRWPLVARDVLYVRLSKPSNITLQALDPRTGGRLWNVSPGGAMAVADGIAYVSASNTLHAIDSVNGEILWTGRMEEEKARLSRPAVGDGVVYAHSNTGHLCAFDGTSDGPETRSPLWIGVTQKQEKRGPQAPALAYGKVYVGAKNTFYAFDVSGSQAAERSPVWTATTEGSFFDPAPSVANGVVYSACGNSYIYAFDASTGDVLWKYSTGRRVFPMRSSPAIVDGCLFHAATFEFKLYAFHVPEKQR
jgi:outer membrane protein assembly factor BamB